MTRLLPQLAKQTEVTSLERFINNDTWVLEQKLDGHRLLLLSPGGDHPPTALTRSGTPYTRKLPKAIQNFRFPTVGGEVIPAGEWVLDGELVDGIFWCFDLPRFPSAPLDMPLHLRRAALEMLLGQIEHPFKLVPQAKTAAEKIDLADRALTNNFEGLLLKQVNAPYRSGGRTEEWLKVKFVKTADVIVTGVRDDGKESVRYCVVDSATGNPLEIGRASLIGKEKSGAINIGDVIEVRYLYVGADGRLYQPTVLRKRFDKFPHECTTDQLQHVNKAVLEAL